MPHGSIPIFTPWSAANNLEREDVAILDSYGHEIGSMNRHDLAEIVVRSVNAAYPRKRGHQYSVGDQPCQNLLRGDADIAALGVENRMNVHQCPICEGNRTWCENCHRDHHDGGWETCKSGAYAEYDQDQ